LASQASNLSLYQESAQILNLSPYPEYSPLGIANFEPVTLSNLPFASAGFEPVTVSIWPVDPLPVAKARIVRMLAVRAFIRPPRV